MKYPPRVVALTMSLNIPNGPCMVWEKNDHDAHHGEPLEGLVKSLPAVGAGNLLGLLKQVGPRRPDVESHIVIGAGLETFQAHSAVGVAVHIVGLFHPGAAVAVFIADHAGLWSVFLAYRRVLDPYLAGREISIEPLEPADRTEEKAEGPFFIYDGDEGRKADDDCQQDKAGQGSNREETGEKGGDKEENGQRPEIAQLLGPLFSQSERFLPAHIDEPAPLQPAASP